MRWPAGRMWIWPRSPSEPIRTGSRSFSRTSGQARRGGRPGGHHRRGDVRASYGNVFDGTRRGTPSVAWRGTSTASRRTPPISRTRHLPGLRPEPAPIADIRDARILVILGDSVTTDHIAPAGDIAENSPAGRFLKGRGVEKKDFNTYGARRGNDRVMARATFANIRLRSSWCRRRGRGHGPSTLGERMDVFDAAIRYRRTACRWWSSPARNTAAGRPGIGRQGSDAGVGRHRRELRADSPEQSDRDGRLALAVQARPGRRSRSASPARSGLTHPGVGDRLLAPGRHGRGRAAGRDHNLVVAANGSIAVEIGYYRNGGILQTVLRKMLKGCRRWGRTSGGARCGEQSWRRSFSVDCWRRHHRSAQPRPTGSGPSPSSPCAMTSRPGAGRRGPGRVGRMATAPRSPRPSGTPTPRCARRRSDRSRRCGRSGDPAVDRLFLRGVEQMQRQELDDAIEDLHGHHRAETGVRRGVEQARDGVYLAGELDRSLADCDEVLKRNPAHFGACSGTG